MQCKGRSHTGLPTAFPQCPRPHVEASGTLAAGLASFHQLQPVAFLGTCVWQAGKDCCCCCCLVAELCPTLLLCPWDFSDKSSGVGRHVFSRGSSDPGIKPASPASVGGFFTAEPQAHNADRQTEAKNRGQFVPSHSEAPSFHLPPWAPQIQSRFCSPAGQFRPGSSPDWLPLSRSLCPLTSPGFGLIKISSYSHDRPGVFLQAGRNVVPPEAPLPA